jgi:hypothetical protein
MRAFLLTVLCMACLFARDPLGQRIRHNDPAKYRPSKAVHGGAGQLDFSVMFDPRDFNASVLFLHRGVIAPKSGIGHQVLIDDVHSIENPSGGALELMVIGVAMEKGKIDAANVQ